MELRDLKTVAELCLREEWKALVIAALKLRKAETDLCLRLLDGQPTGPSLELLQELYKKALANLQLAGEKVYLEEIPDDLDHEDICNLYA